MKNFCSGLWAVTFVELSGDTTLSFDRRLIHGFRSSVEPGIGGVPGFATSVEPGIWMIP